MATVYIVLNFSSFGNLTVDNSGDFFVAAGLCRIFVTRKDYKSVISSGSVTVVRIDVVFVTGVGFPYTIST